MTAGGSGRTRGGAPPVRRGPGGPRRAAPSRPRARRTPRYRRRRLAAALVGGLLLVITCAFGVRILLYDSGLADVETVTVTGAAAVPVAEVTAAAAVEPGIPLAAVDTDAVASRVAALAGIASVQVERDWPHAVVVAVLERQPVAVAASAQGPVLVDSTGLGYRPAPDGVDLPRLTFDGVSPGHPPTVAAITVLAALPDPVRGQVETVGVGTGGQLSLGLTKDREVRWGVANRSADKAAVLVALLTQPGSVYDVASPELPTIRP